MRSVCQLFVVLLSGCLSAAPPGDLATLLAGSIMQFSHDDGVEPDLQSWKADGTTVFHIWGLARYPRPGVWKVEGRRYCSDFPDPGQAPKWVCYWVKVLEDGAVLKFDEIGKSWQLIQFTSFWRGRFVR